MINFNKVSFSYKEGEQWSLKDISLSIFKGEFVLICGESGCGKTTITRLINGLIPNFFNGKLSGTIKVLGYDTSNTNIADLSDMVGTVFQNPRTQFFNADTDSEIVFGMENKGLPVPYILERLSIITKELDLQNLRNRNIFELSGGEKQKIAFASVYAPSPDILVLDEPSSNLDYKSIKELSNLLKKAKKSGITIIVSEHRIWYLMELIDRVLFIKKGRLEREFLSDEFKNLSEEEYKKMKLRSRNLFSAKFREEKKFLSIKKDVLHIENISVEIGNKKILDKINFEIKSGEILAITGFNGSGKTTLARVLCGLQKADGKIRLNSKSLNYKERIKISYMVMQDVGHQLFTDSVESECKLGVKKVSKESIDKVLCDMELINYKDRHPLSLSGGQKQRLAVVVSMLCDKKILIFDEPTSGLDLYSMKKVADILYDLSKQDKFIIVITHDYELIERACSHVLNLENGKLVADFKTNELYKIYGGIYYER